MPQKKPSPFCLTPLWLTDGEQTTPSVGGGQGPVPRIRATVIRATRGRAEAKRLRHLSHVSEWASAEAASGVGPAPGSAAQVG